MIKLERDIERSLVRMVKRNGGQCLKWVSPGWSGVPDRIILMPLGNIIFVETKRPECGEIAPLQNYWAQKIRSLGFRHFYVHSQVDIDMLEHIIRAL